MKINIHPLELRRIVDAAIKDVETLRVRVLLEDIGDILGIKRPETTKKRTEMTPEERNQHLAAYGAYMRARLGVARILKDGYLTKLYQMRAHLRGKVHARNMKLFWHQFEEPELQEAALANGGKLTKEITLEEQAAMIPRKMWEEVILKYRDPIFS